jgi:UDP-N-acetylglucosamine--N-acetylmuramyl-(pentapeptide) pyrophosphoryl-undecaprenol N-acetylglucosamine transferase
VNRARPAAGASVRTILIMAGGTGGHIFPALAVAEELRLRGWRVVWLGAKTGMEAHIVPRHGYPIEWIRFSGLRGKGWLRAALLPMNLLFAFFQSARVLFRVRPDVVLGMGGYVAFPGGMMAALFLRPFVIHEQNAIAGLTNRLLAEVADRVLVAFPGALRKAAWTGNPVRGAIAALAPPRQRYAPRSGRLHVLVVGGSLGARALNENLPQAVSLLSAAERPRITHQSGAQHVEALKAAYQQAQANAEVVPFIDDMAREYGQADLVICRAGATTVAELAVAGVASVLIPFPHAVDDHQSANARFLSDAGAAVLLPQKEMTPRRLADLLLGFTRERLLAMAEAARALGRPDAARQVADACATAAA